MNTEKRWDGFKNRKKNNDNVDIQQTERGERTRETCRTQTELITSNTVKPSL